MGWIKKTVNRVSGAVKDAVHDTGGALRDFGQSEWVKWGAATVGGGLAGLAARAVYTGYNTMKDNAAAQVAAANRYADAQARVAESIEAASTVSPTAVQAPTVSAQQVAEQDAASARKRKRTIASTVNAGYALGGLNGRTTLG